jgi:hypothetical protein
LLIVVIYAGHPRIIHKDSKASNILIDYNFEAQVLYFLHCKAKLP